MEKKRNDNNKKNKKKQSLLDQATDLISSFIGSWWGVFFHTAWFTGWFIFNLDMNVLTFAVSLEAIFIGIFLLISDSKAEIIRDKRNYAAQKRETDLTEAILDVIDKQDRRQQQMLQSLSELQIEISEIKIKTLKKSKVKAEINGK